MRVLRTVSSVARLTRASFLAVGAAPATEMLARAATATAKKREMNICEIKMSGGHCEA